MRTHLLAIGAVVGLLGVPSSADAARHGHRKPVVTDVKSEGAGLRVGASLGLGAVGFVGLGVLGVLAGVGIGSAVNPNSGLENLVPGAAVGALGVTVGGALGVWLGHRAAGGTTDFVTMAVPALILSGLGLAAEGIVMAAGAWMQFGAGVAGAVFLGSIPTSIAAVVIAELSHESRVEDSEFPTFALVPARGGAVLAMGLSF